MATAIHKCRFADEEGVVRSFVKEQQMSELQFNSDEFAEGYNARLSNQPFERTATCSHRAGWSDADVRIGSEKALEEERRKNFPEFYRAKVHCCINWPSLWRWVIRPLYFAAVFVLMIYLWRWDDAKQSADRRARAARYANQMPTIEERIQPETHR